MLCLFLFHIDYTIYANHALIRTTMSNHKYRTHYKIIGSDSIFVKNIFMWGKSSAVMY